MLNTSQWPERDLGVLKDIHLDPKNVRLETPTAAVEADIMEDLFANENVLALVKGISEVGYLTHELPVAIERKGRYVMVEGNRRLAALKAIQNPMLVPEFSARVTQLADAIPDRSALATIRVMVAPDQTVADQLVAAIHTSNLRRPWTPARQAVFFQTQIDAGRSYKTLKRRYPTIDVRRFVFRAHILNAFKSVKYADASLVDYVQTKAWSRSLSALARIYESKEFLEITGFQMDEDGKFSKKITDSQFRKLATVIVNQMRDGGLNTRTLNTVNSPRFAQLMGELRVAIGQKKAPSGPSGNTGSTGGKGKGPGSDSHKGGSGASSGKKARSGPPPKRKAQTHLDLGQVVPPGSYPLALRRHLEELSGLDVQVYPNSAFLLMRAVLEKSIKSFATAKEEDIKKTHNEKGWVQLGETLKWLLTYVKKVGDKGMIQPIERVRTGKLQYATTVDAMNAVSHNQHVEFDGDEAIDMWTSIEPILRYVTNP